MADAPPTGRFGREPVLLFAVGLVLRLAALQLAGAHHGIEGMGAWEWGQEPACLADAMARGDGSSDPFGRDTGASSWLTPFYPGLLALSFRLFGSMSTGAALALFLLQALASAWTSPLIASLGRSLGAPLAGRIAGWIWALHPLAIWYAVHKIWDTTLVATVLTAFLAFVVRGGRRPSSARAAATGALFGLMLLLNPAPVAILPAVLLYLLPRGPGRWRAGLTRGGLLVAAATLVVLPWSVRNIVVLGAGGLRSNLGVELAVGNNDAAVGWHVKDLHPGWVDVETERLRRLGEAAYAAERGREAWAWIRANPGRFARLVVARAAIFWIGVVPTDDPRQFHGLTAARDVKSWGKWAIHVVTGVLGLGGLFLLGRGTAEGALVRGTFLLFPIVYYVTHSLERYRFPLDPLVLVCGMVLVLRFLPRARRPPAAS